MRILGGGIFKGMAVTLRNFVGSYINKKERLPTNDYSWRADGALPAKYRRLPERKRRAT